VHNCTVRNNTDGAVDVQCEPGYDGGLQQVFVLEVFAESLDSQTDGEILYRNMTDRTSPRFSLGKVALGVLYTARMYAANAKGKSTAVTLPRFSFPSSENQMGEYRRRFPVYHTFFHRVFYFKFSDSVPFVYNTYLTIAYVNGSNLRNLVITIYYTQTLIEFIYFTKNIQTNFLGKSYRLFNHITFVTSRILLL
jgi:hypothetical protein